MDFSDSVDRCDTAGFFVNPGMDNSHDRDRISSRIKCNDCLASRHQKSSGELRLCRQRENYIVELSLTILIVDGVIGYFALDLYCESAYACQIAPCNL
jgi:hypothetical protein